ncbi:MAG: hypothetical protein ACXWFG_04620 [Methylobacter sp.]
MTKSSFANEVGEPLEYVPNHKATLWAGYYTVQPGIAKGRGKAAHVISAPRSAIPITPGTPPKYRVTFCSIAVFRFHGIASGRVNGIGDVLSWIALGIPMVITFWCFLRRA